MIGKIIKINIYLKHNGAEGIQRQNQQAIYNTEYTVTAHKKQISTFVNFYQVQAGKVDFGKLGVKIAKSFQAYIQKAAINEMLSVVSAANNKYGIAGYKGTGTDTQSWIEISQLVRAANASDVYALGTLGALAKIVPDAAGFRFFENDDLTRKGFLKEYQQVPLVQIDNAIVPNTINGTTPTLTVSDDYIFFLPMAFNKPIKVAIEGENVLVATDPMTTKDCTIGLTVSMYIGVEAVVGSKFGVLDVR